MSNDLSSILARHNLKGINVANFSPSSAASSQRPSPQHQPYQYAAPPPQQPYQYPASVPQPRAQYTWAPPQGGGGSAVRPSFAWPAPPQPRYTIDPRHYSYDIWGKAPVFSMDGEDEEEQEAEGEEEAGKGEEANEDASADDEVEADDGVQEEEEAVAGKEEEVTAEGNAHRKEETAAQGDADAVADMEKSIEAETTADEALAEETVEASPHGENIPPEGPESELDAVTKLTETGSDASSVEPPSDPSQDDASSSPDVLTTAEPPVEEETAAAPTESTPGETDAEASSELVTSKAADLAAHKPESVPDADLLKEADNQTDERSIELADTSVEETAATEEPIVEQPDEISNRESGGLEPASEVQEEAVDPPQQSEYHAEDIGTDDMAVAETPELSDGNPSSTDPAPEDLIPKDEPSDDIPEEPLSAAEVDAKPPETEPSVDAVSTESEETGLMVTLPESEHTPDSAPIETSDDPDEIVQIIDVGNDGSTDDTAAIVVVVPPSDDTAAIIIPPPPPSPGPRVTIAEPIKPSKLSKKKPSSSKSSKSRSSERPKEKPVERPVEIIQLREGKSKTISKAKSKKKSKSVSSKGGESALPPPPPPSAIVDVPPRAPSPPPNGTAIEDAEAEEMQVIDDYAAGGDIISLPEVESEAIEAVAAGEASVVAAPDVEEASAEALQHKEEITQANALPLAEVNVITTPVENGGGKEGSETGADVEHQPEPTREELDSSPPEANPTSEEPQVDSPSGDDPLRDLPEHTGPSDDENSVAEPITLESENHNEPELVTAKKQPENASIAEPFVEENGETGTPTPPNVKSQADGGLESVEVPSAAGIEETVSSGDTHDGVGEAESQDPAIEPEKPEGSMAKDAPEEVLDQETVEPKAEEHIFSEETAPIAETEETSRLIEEPQSDSVEVNAEPTPTLMELAALILPTEAALTVPKDTAVPEAMPAEDGVSTIEPTAVEEAPDPILEAIVSQDNDLNGQAVIVLLPDDEETLDVPPEAPIPPGTEVPDDNFMADDEGEASQHQEPEETSEPVENEDIQPELSPEVVAPVEDEAGDQELKAKTEVFDSLDRNAETPKADVSRYSATTGILDERALETGKSNADAMTVDEPEVPEPQATYMSRPAVEEPDATQTAEAPQQLSDQDSSDADTDVVRKTDVPRSEEEEALADSVTDTEVHDLDTPVTGGESGEGVSASSPASTPESKTEAIESAEELQEVALAEVSTEAEVTRKLVIDDVEVGKLADNEATTEPMVEEPATDEAEDVVVSEPASEQVDNASEPFVVESADSEARETPGKHVSADSTESHDIEDLSEQFIEPELEYISDKEDGAVVNTINDVDNAFTTTNGAGAQAEDHDLPLLSMPVLAEEAQVIEVEDIETSEGAAEDISKPEKEEKTSKATELVDTPFLEETPESNEISSPGEQPIPPVEDSPTEPPELPESTEPPEQIVPEESIEPERTAQPDSPAQEPSTESEVLPGDSASQQSRCETLPDSEAAHSAPLPEEPSVDSPAPVEDAPSKQSSKVSFDEPPISPQGREPVSPPRERRKSSKSSSSRHSSSRYKVKDASSPTPNPKPPPPPTQSRRRSSTANAPPPGLFRTPSTAKPRPTRAELAEQAELRRREAEIAAREQEVQRQLRRARKRAAVEEQERRLREKEEELARLEAIEREKKKVRREEKKRRTQEALEQERAARERAEEEVRQKEFERAERRRRRKEAEASGSRRHRDDRPRAHRQSTGHPEPQASNVVPTTEPRVSRQRTEDIGAERRRSRDEYYIREVPAPSRDSEQRRHRRSTRRDSEKDEKPKKGFWKSILGRI